MLILFNVDLKSALSKKRRDGKTAPLQPLTTMQRVYIGRLIEKYGDDYQVVLHFCVINSGCSFPV